MTGPPTVNFSLVLAQPVMTNSFASMQCQHMNLVKDALLLLVKNLAPSHSRPSCPVLVSSWHLLLRESILRLQSFSTSTLWPATKDASEGTSYHLSAPRSQAQPLEQRLGQGRGQTPLWKESRHHPFPTGCSCPSTHPRPAAKHFCRPRSNPLAGKHPSHSKDAPTEDPTSGWVETEVKSGGPKEETEPETELSKRNLVKKRRRRLKVSLLEGSRWPGSCASRAVALSQTDHGALTPSLLCSASHATLHTHKVRTRGVFSDLFSGHSSQGEIEENVICPGCMYYRATAG